jgi:hypothetical protein
MRWKLVVSSSTDVPIYEYGPEGIDGHGGLIGFPNFDIDASGNCLTMSFSAVPSLANIRPRDYLTLYRYDAIAEDWVPWWKGVVTIAGTDRSDEPQDYQALGLKQIFYERVLNANRWPAPPALSVDAASVPSITTDITAIPGVTVDGTSFPTLGFSLGVALPGRETFGDFLDARARLVGQFVVPTGETYEYDGVTFSAGDVVPEVRWGVDATGRFFFRRVGVNDAPTLTLDEDDPEVRVDWSPFISEGKSNSFTFVLLGGVERERLLSSKVTQSYSGPSGFDQSYTSTEQTFIPYSVVGPAVTPADPVVEEPVNVTSPLDYMSRSSMSFKANETWSDLSNATNNNLANFAQFGEPFTAITASGGTETTVGDYQIHTFTAGGTFTVSDAGSNPEVEYLIVAGGGGGAYSTTGAGSGVSPGGGAGGMLSGNATVTATSYTITVGSGGLGQTASTASTAGGNSSALSITATGGGRAASLRDGFDGGSGGGARGIIGQGSGDGGLGTAGQGNNGGNASTAISPIAYSSAAGGGGAGAAAARSNEANRATAGGVGLASTISGSAVTYATGGDAQDGAGGGADAAANTGDGGAGGVDADGGDGGSGIVIIRYRITNPDPVRAAGSPFDFGNPAVIESNTVGTGPGAFVLWYSSDQPVAFALRRNGTLSGTTDGDAFEINTTMEVQYEFPATNTDTEIRPRQIVLPALAPTTIGRNNLNNAANTLFIFGVLNLRIYDCAFYSANLTTIERIAEALSRNPIEDAAGITVNDYEPVASSVVVNPITGSPASIKVERVEYSLGIEQGVQTKFYAGQRFDAALETERVVLTSFNRRTTTVDSQTASSSSSVTTAPRVLASFRTL